MSRLIRASRLEDLYEKLYRRRGRAELLGEWEDGPVTRIGFLGDLRGGWTKTLLERSLRDGPGMLGVVTV